MKITVTRRLSDLDYDMLLGSLMLETLLRNRLVVVEQPGEGSTFKDVEAWLEAHCTGLYYLKKHRALTTTRVAHFEAWRDLEAFQAAFPA